MIKKTILLKVLSRLLIINLLFISCKTESAKYPYQKGLSNYLNTIFNLDLKTFEDKIFYFLPISECISCKGTGLQLNMLNNLGGFKNLTLIVIGLELDSKFRKEIESLKQTKLFDDSSIIFNYQTGVGKPLLIHMKNGKIIYNLKVSDLKIENAKKFIERNAID